MKKILFSLAFMTGFVSFAQDFQGMAVYESKTSTAEFMKNMPKNRDITPEMQKSMEERMKKMFEKTFILNFNRTASVYKEEEKLDMPGQENAGRMMRMMGGGGTHYKNVKEKIYVEDKEFMGKEFLIKDTLPKLEWKLENETKQIGNYTCFKATAIKPIDESDFRNFRMRRRNEDEKAKETEEKKDTLSDSAKVTNFMDQLEIPKEVTITAWYSPEIPVNQGPENYWGLPGLILEVNDGQTTILCSKIVLNSKEKVDIKPVTKGKEVTQKEYNEIVMKKMKEMQEMFRNNRNGGHRGGFGPR
ncbi:GLPGLI family protein [Flavobacterium sp. NRK F10]|uniref:GLPGLI family protein n=1 Tax=Flavobacterium sp. NRK F10 TaxID=2954931 RepID=UPI0020912AB3|nr:GLPGLI family protein [Flavobacterium sp. NRK F10]MCO6174394.1 GLPGLI family protein [Flavobacterium sp. NRK F10]